MHHHHLIRTIWGLDLNAIADKLEALGRIWAALVAACSAIMALLPDEHTAERHPHLAACLRWVRHTAATVAMDTSAPVVRYFRKRRQQRLSINAAASNARDGLMYAQLAWKAGAVLTLLAAGCST